MNNIFEGAKFGDKYINRAGKVLIFQKIWDGYANLFSENSVWSCPLDGKNGEVENEFDIIGKYQESIDKHKLIWYDLKDKTICFPSKSDFVLVMNENLDWYNICKYSLISVKKLLDVCDKPYCRWTHWMRIPSIVNDYINEDKLDQKKADIEKACKLWHKNILKAQITEEEFRQAMEG